ncbi:uncharacterized protein BDZ99DRAFT_498141 [Mytilinidion resinicola]|uniref:Uncharacterized protein n=1 Tax=Mytilinidion resinicola TaxID=574789 RepID=A0A6A6YPJ0_9PEZI|nr:uncharacterized protein BDZ99DRAFT_498141 [Mytilinidion resinicola]KAF2809895.1 hypothetical protein BDZ99DRAFT_498141 [Mytilinidion resinicola]
MDLELSEEQNFLFESQKMAKPSKKTQVASASDSTEATTASTPLTASRDTTSTSLDSNFAPTNLGEPLQSSEGAEALTEPMDQLINAVENEREKLEATVAKFGSQRTDEVADKKVAELEREGVELAALEEDIRRGLEKKQREDEDVPSPPIAQTPPIALPTDNASASTEVESTTPNTLLSSTPIAPPTNLFEPQNPVATELLRNGSQLVFYPGELRPLVTPSYAQSMLIQDRKDTSLDLNMCADVIRDYWAMLQRNPKGSNAEAVAVQKLAAWSKILIGEVEELSDQRGEDWEKRWTAANAGVAKKKAAKEGVDEKPVAQFVIGDMSAENIKKIVQEELAEQKAEKTVDSKTEERQILPPELQQLIRPETIMKLTHIPPYDKLDTQLEIADLWKHLRTEPKDSPFYIMAYDTLVHWTHYLEESERWAVQQNTAQQAPQPSQVAEPIPSGQTPAPTIRLPDPGLYHLIRPEEILSLPLPDEDKARYHGEASALWSKLKTHEKGTAPETSARDSLTKLTSKVREAAREHQRQQPAPQQPPGGYTKGKPVTLAEVEEGRNADNSINEPHRSAKGRTFGEIAVSEFSTPRPQQVGTWTGFNKKTRTQQAYNPANELPMHHHSGFPVCSCPVCVRAAGLQLPPPMYSDTNSYPMPYTNSPLPQYDSYKGPCTFRYEDLYPIPIPYEDEYSIPIPYKDEYPIPYEDVYTIPYKVRRNGPATFPLTSLPEWDPLGPNEPPQYEQVKSVSPPVAASAVKPDPKQELTPPQNLFPNKKQTIPQEPKVDQKPTTKQESTTKQQSTDTTQNTETQFTKNVASVLARFPEPTTLAELLVKREEKLHSFKKDSVKACTTLTDVISQKDQKIETFTELLQQKDKRIEQLEADNETGKKRHEFQLANREEIKEDQQAEIEALKVPNQERMTDRELEMLREVAGVREESEKLRAEKENLQAENEELRVEKQSLQAENARLWGEKENLQVGNEMLQAEGESLRAEKEALRADAEALRARYQNSQAEIKHLRDTTIRNIKKKGVRPEHLFPELQQLFKDAIEENIRTENERLKDHFGKLTADNESLKDKVKRLTGVRKRYARHIDGLHSQRLAHGTSKAKVDNTRTNLEDSKAIKPEVLSDKEPDVEIAPKDTAGEEPNEDQENGQGSEAFPSLLKGQNERQRNELDDLSSLIKKFRVEEEKALLGCKSCEKVTPERETDREYGKTMKAKGTELEKRLMTQSEKIKEFKKAFAESHFPEIGNRITVDQLDALENNTILDRAAEARKAIESLKSENRRLKEASEKNAIAYNRIFQQLAKLQTAQTDLDDLRKIYSETFAELETAQKSLAELRESSNQATLDFDSARREAQELQNALQDSQAALDLLAAEHERVWDKIHGEEDRLADVEDAKQELVAMNEKLKADSENLKADLELAQKQFLQQGNNLTSVIRPNANLEDEKRSLTADVNKLTMELQSAQSQLGQPKGNLDSTEKENQELTAKNEQLTTNVDDLDRELVTSRHKLRQQADQLSSIVDQNVLLGDEKHQLTTDLEDMTAKIEGAHQQLRDLIRKGDLSEQNIRRLTAEKEQLTGEIKNLAMELDSAWKQSAERVAHLNNVLHESQRVSAQLATEHEQLKTKHKILEAEHKRYGGTMEQQASEIRQLKDDYSAASRAATTLQHQNSERLESFQRLSGQVSELRAAHELAGKTVRGLMAENENLKAEYKDACECLHVEEQSSAKWQEKASRLAEIEKERDHVIIEAQDFKARIVAELQESKAELEAEVSAKALAEAKIVELQGALDNERKNNDDLKAQTESLQAWLDHAAEESSKTGTWDEAAEVEDEEWVQLSAEEQQRPEYTDWRP